MKQRILYTAFLAHLIDDGCEVVLLPLLPLMAKELSFSNAQIGLIGGVFIIVAGIFQFFTGYISDYIRKKKDLVALGFFLVAAGLTSISLGDSFLWILGGASILGVGLSFYHPVGISVVTTHFRTERGRAIGIHGTGGAIGLLLAPAYSGFVGELWGWRPALRITAVLCVAVGLLYYFSVKDISFKRSKRKLSVLITPAAITVMIVLGLAGMCSRGFSTFFPVRLVRMGYSSGFSGGLLSVFLGMGIFGQYIGGTLSDRFSHKKVISISLMFTAIFFVPLLRTENTYLLYLFAMITGLFLSIVWPAIFAYIADLAPEDMHSRALGVFGTVSAVMSGSAPIMIGYISGVILLWNALLILPLFGVAGALIMFVMRE